MLAKLLTGKFVLSGTDNVAVIGLGRFGRSVAQSLTELGHDVMGIDKKEERVQSLTDVLTHTVQADSTNLNVMRQLGMADFPHAIVGIGSDIAASLMTIMVLTELGVKDIWVKAMSEEHGKIAQRVGAHHVVFPEADMGERIAHLITGHMVDFLEFDDGFAIAKLHAPAMMHHRALADSDVQEKFGITVIGVKRANEDFRPASSDMPILADDLLIVSGPTHKIQDFAHSITSKRL